MLTHYFAAPGSTLVIPKDRRTLRMEEITDKICEFLEVHRLLVYKATRVRHVVEARQLCMYFCTLLTKETKTGIGEFYGHRDHTTVIHALQTVRDLMHTDPEYRAKVIAIGKLF
jgi:chromosomal replication initiator protein